MYEDFVRNINELVERAAWWNSESGFSKDQGNSVLATFEDLKLFLATHVDPTRDHGKLVKALDVIENIISNHLLIRFTDEQFTQPDSTFQADIARLQAHLELLRVNAPTYLLLD